ncbi:unnamed protein product [Didymodactylos carnosus]|uniref:Protein-tyrosine-phosphatase n=1 Tax=Didymodactylos carnosus TaxID=1234261 RepID=A0A814G8X1_9BILA|nr:unnamed protein product [Didymodactylos carnosus]CAF0994614.1 unnamed protein product [Didymodactylos carnosus]CAF3500110.1 unnamed protein product [Didymodactylos carnosus]CAF3766314.1 unnamed protein product [Didymodactylos carnosus]
MFSTSIRFSADCVDDHVWLGDLEAAENTFMLDKLNITHILTILDYKPVYNKDDKRIRLYIEAEDIGSYDLLSSFETCYHFIENAVQNNHNILIHCQAGISRSATIVAMYFMKKYTLTHEEAIEKLSNKRCYHMVCPNNGFQSQLQLYHQMNYAVDKTHELYKDFQSERLRTNYGLEKSDKITKTEKEIIDDTDRFPIKSEEKTLETEEVEYQCKTCQHKLFTRNDLFYHQQGRGKSDWSTKPLELDETICDKQVFTYYTDWMIDVFDSNVGDIHCISCQTKLGEYSLDGKKCECGHWVMPAFHFDQNQIERHNEMNHNHVEKS